MKTSSEKNEEILKSFDKIKNWINNIPLYSIQKQVQENCGYDGNYISWRDEADSAIESLEVMALLGDENAFRALHCLAHEIVETLNRLAVSAAECSSDEHEKSSGIFTSDPSLPSNKSEVEIGLDSLANSTVEDLSEILKSIDSRGATKIGFYPRDLIKISRAANDLPTPDSTNSKWDDDHSETGQVSSKYILKEIVNKLAGMRVHKAACLMIRKQMNDARKWPVSLSSMKELSDSELRSYYSLDIGRDLPLERNSEMKRGKTRSLDAETPTGLALYVYENLERFRCYPYADVHLCEIRMAYEKTAVAELLALKNVMTIDNLWERPKWHQDNWWKLMAALLPPFSSEAIVIQKWTDAGVWYCRHTWNQLENAELLPKFLRQKACHSTEDPSSKAIRTAVSNALANGFISLAGKAPQ